MADNHNFRIKNGLEVGGVEVINANGVMVLPGTSTAATQDGGTNNTHIATTAFVQQEITSLIGGAPGSLNTLNELAAAINDDASYATTLTTALGTKLPLSGGTMTGALTLSGTTTFNNGRGDVYFENNANSNASGAGITLRTGDNPLGDGSIFDVRSSGEAIRFFVGQDLTSSGYNPFFVGLNNSTTGQGTGSNYAIELATNGNINASGVITATGGNSTNWNTAYGWGDHSTEGYLTSYTDTNTTYSAGTGITLTGTEFSLTDTNAKLNLTGGTLTGGLTISTGNLNIRTQDEENPTDVIYLGASNGNGPGTSNDIGTGLVFAPQYTGYTKRSAGIMQIGEGNYFRSGLAFYTNNTSDQTTDWSERMRLTMEGNLNLVSGSFTMGGNTVIDSSRNLTVATGASSGKFAVMASSPHGTYDFYNNGTTYLNGSTIVDDALNLTGGNAKLQISGTTVIDSSRNLTNIGTISSGAITSTVINTGDATLLTLHHDTGADLAQQKSFIDFSFADTNTNETPQVRIGAEVGQNNNADTQEKEGSGAFVVYTNNADTISGAAGASLAERFRVDYVGNTTSTGTVTATGGNSTNWNTAYGWGNHASQSYATQSYVGTQISNLVDSSPLALNTLNELAAALGDDENFSTTVTDSIATKLPLAGGTMTGDLKVSKSNAAIYLNDSSGSPTQQGMRIRAESIDTNLPNNEGIGIVFEEDPANGSPDTTPAVITTGEFYSQSNKKVWHEGTLTTTNKSNYDTAYGWGDHSTEGYLTSYTDTNTTYSAGTGITLTGTEFSLTDTNAKLNLSGGTLSGTLNIVTGDSSESVINLYGGSQGTGKLYVGQSTTHGGGIEYNGDGTPTSSGSGADYVTLFRRTGGVDSWTARNFHSSDDWKFRGSIYANDTQRVFADNYHPNADTWTTARSHTVTLTGEVTGTATQSVNGSGNKTWSIATTLGNTALNDQYIKRGTPSLTSNITTIAPSSDIVRWNGTTTGRPASGQSNEYGSMLQMAYDGTRVSQLAHDFDQDNLYFRQLNTSTDTGTTWEQIFHDTYHPNADVWTTARNHTVTLTGDVTGTATQSVNGSGNKTWTVATTASAPSAPSAPSITATSVVGETIEVTFSQSSTSGVDHYEVWSDGGSGTDYSLVARIPEVDIASSMSIVDSSFDDGGTIAYRAYAVKNGVYSTAATATRAYTVSTSLDVASLSVVPDINVYHISYNKPDSRFIDHIEIYKDAEAVQGNLSRTGATLVYSGANSAFTYSIGASDLDKYHQFWVEVVAV